MSSVMDKLCHAVETDDVVEAKLIICENEDIIDLNSQLGSTYCYTTLLMLACERGCVEMVKLLAENRKKPAKVNMTDSDGNRPISVAVNNQHMKLLRFLLETKAKPNVCCGRHFYTTPLIMACDLEDMGIVKLLIANKADVNMTDFQGVCPIWVAVMSQNLELASFLLHNTAANPNVNVNRIHRYHNKNTHSSTPLIEACKMEDMNMVRLLLENKSHPADINMADGNGVRPLSVALQTQNLDLVYMLLHLCSSKLDLNYACVINLQSQYITTSSCQHVRQHIFYTPLMQAITMKDEVLVSDLIKAGADVNPCNLIQQNIIDYSPLMEAASQDNLDICSILLQHGSDVSAVSSPKTHSKTALTIAAQSQKTNYLDIAALLLEHGAVHPQSKCGRSLPMYLALFHNKATLVDLFMKHGYKFRKYPSPNNSSGFRDELCDAIEADAEDCCLLLLQWGFNVKAILNDYPYFCAAAERGMTRLSMLLIQIYPRFLQERWLVDFDIHNCGWDDNACELGKRLHEERRQPKTLQELCKAMVLQSLISKCQQESLSTQINNLEPLPRSIKQFLKLQDGHTF